MIKIHDRDLRGKTKMGWLDSNHTFSFGSFQDPDRMGFRSLRVFNDDIIIGGSGFAPHRHEDMEIISYVLDGALEHKDSQGNIGVIKPGDIQRMSAGSGIEHSEYNASKDEKAHFLQIWIIPEEKGIEPSYEQIAFDTDKLSNGFTLVGDRQGSGGGITIHQDVQFYVAHLDEGKTANYSFKNVRGGFLYLAKGRIELNGEVLKEGDAAQIEDVSRINVKSLVKSEVLLFDMM